MARKAVISYLRAPQDPNVSSISVQNGDRLILSDEGEGVLFDGIVLSEESSESSATASNTAYDYAWYLRNKICGVFKGSPAEVAGQICTYLGIPCGDLYDPGGEAEIVSTGEKTAYQGIAEAYEGSDAHIYMEGMALCVEQYGQILAGTLTGDDRITDAAYKSSLENMVNRVIILDAADQPVGEVGNGLSEFGAVQDFYKAAGDAKNPQDEAAKLLKGFENSGKVSAVGGTAFVTGRAVIVEKAGTKIRGRFVIISDEHSFANAEHTITLGLRFGEVA